MRVSAELQERNSVVQLRSEGLDKVIDNDKVLKVSILNNPQVLDEDASFGLKAVIAIQHVPYVQLKLIEFVDHCFCVRLMCSSEHIDLIVAAHPL